jgi:Ca2+-binding RTX toxin-like protein
VADDPAVMLGDQVLATAAADRVQGTAQHDAIVGLEGDDLVCGDGGQDLTLGSAGEDRLHGCAGDDRIRDRPDVGLANKSRIAFNDHLVGVNAVLGGRVSGKCHRYRRFA